MKTVLVTGGAGFIGANFVCFLLKTEPKVNIINLDLLTYAGSLENLKDLPGSDRYTFIQGDICDFRQVNGIFKRFPIDTVVHFAAETHVDRSILGPAKFIKTNVMGTFTLLEAARLSWLSNKTLPALETRFHHISTDEVYGSLKPEEPAFSEQTPYAPNSPYAASKASSDHLVRAYSHTYGLPATITNCSNNYGPYQYPEKLIPLMILNALEGKPLPVYGDGQQIRDWLYVEDHCEAIWKVLRDGKPGETYNIGGNNQPTNLVVLNTLCDILDECRPSSLYVPHRDLIQFVKDRPGHDRRYAMDTSKIERELGWQPKQSLETGLLKTVKWYLDHPDWVEVIRSRGDYEYWMQQNYEQRIDIE
jgi:dTDP-glucose 4,6-dehydratase